MYTATFWGPHSTVLPPTTSGVPNTSASPARTVTATCVAWSSSIRSSWPAGSGNVSDSLDIFAFAMVSWWPRLCERRRRVTDEFVFGQELFPF